MAQGKGSDGRADRKKCCRVAMARRRISISPKLRPHAAAHLEENNPGFGVALWYPTKASYPRSSEPSKRFVYLLCLEARWQATCPREFQMLHYRSMEPLGYLLSVGDKNDTSSLSIASPLA